MDNSNKIKAIVAYFSGKQHTFAQTMGVSDQVVTNWCKRGVNSIETLQAIIDAFPRLNPSFFFDDCPIEKGVPQAPTEEDVISRFLTIIEEKDRQIARLIEIIGKGR